MRIGGIGNIYPNFVYNTNAVNANSLNKLSRISDNVLDKRTDYETNTEENQNPLRKGETKDFQNILAKQMQEGQNRAAAILPFGLAPTEKATASGEETKAAAQTAEPASGQGTREAGNTETDRTANVSMISENQDQNRQEQNVVSYQMQRAMQAYEMFTAV